MAPPSPSPPVMISSGLVHLTQLHHDRSDSLQSHDSLRLFPSVSHSTRLWSWKTLRSHFESKDSERLFTQYHSRIQNAFFIVILTLNVSLNLLSFLLYFLSSDSNSFPGPIILRAGALLVHSTFLYISWRKGESLLQDNHFSQTMSSSMTFIAMLFSEYGTALYSFNEVEKLPYHLMQIRPSFYIIIATHVFLPFPLQSYSCIGSVIVTLIDVGLTLRARIESPFPSDSLFFYTLADVLFLSLAGGIGYLFTHLMEIANRKAFLDHRDCVQSRLKLEYEKEKEEQFLNSCLPKHLTEQVKGDITTVLAKMQTHAGPTMSRPFNQLYMKKFPLVSILYADIVNSMLLTSKLTPAQLVQTLNDLYGRFDEMADRLNCMRIKLLGDCYYCVSGIPTYDINHAINCVDMGLEMISIIKGVREERLVDVNMRIGIHSGMVLSGLIGLHKWQYDIWSKDCMKASSMEHNGVTGMVHVTKQTLDLIPEGPRSRILIISTRKNGDGEEDTYLIERRIMASSNYSPSPQTRRRSQVERMRNIMTNRRRSSIDSLASKRNQFINDLSRYKLMVQTVNEAMEVDISHMPLSKNTRWFNPVGISPIFLNFTPSVLQFSAKPEQGIFSFEMKYISQPDSLFKYYLWSALMIQLGILLIKLIVPHMIFPQKWILGVCASFTTIILSLILTHQVSSLHSVTRIVLWLVVSVGITMTVTIDLILESVTPVFPSNRSAEILSNQGFTWYFTFSFILSMTSVSLFIRIHYWLKTAFHISSIGLFSYLVTRDMSIIQIVDKDMKWTFLENHKMGHIIYVVLIGILLHIIDRQIEYMMKLDFQWRTRLERRRCQSARVGLLNKILLQNILPIHVADMFIHSTTLCPEDGLYSEPYSDIAVMFASIPNYSDFYNESKINEDGLKCLLLLNEIICDFDKVLSMGKFSRVEKIKTIGSTYMAACGLRPGRRAHDARSSIDDAIINAETMVNFAISLMHQIDQINRDALQDFKLRIGISIGPVIAGVVGSMKPQYDIWGDTVNVSSRMESTGISGQIHVTKQVAQYVRSCKQFVTTCRGPIHVKGKGQLVTYFISSSETVQGSSTTF